MTTPTQQPYRASTRSRIIVWGTLAVVLVALLSFIGSRIYSATNASNREDKLIGACRQEARRHLGKGSDRANFDKERTFIAQPQSSVVGILVFNGTRREFQCNAYLEGDHWTVMEFRFT